MTGGVGVFGLRLGRRFAVSGRALRRLRTGHPWIFADELRAALPPEPAVGLVVGPENRPAAWALSSPHSKIALRVLGPPEVIEDPDPRTWLPARLERAIARRAPLAEVTNAARLVHSEGDGLPGLIVDRYADVLVVQSATAGIEALLPYVVSLLVARFDPAMVLARNDHRTRRLEGLPERIELLHGRRVERVWIEEHGLALPVAPFRGQKTGFYLDQRPARRLVHEQTALSGGPVIDLCAYAGACALQAARAGAEVAAVDGSAFALELLAEGARRNGLAVEGVRANVFRWLAAASRAGRRARGIVLDPPAFAPRRADREPALRAYTRLNTKALSLLEPGGWLLTCSCSHHVSPQDFRSALAAAAAAAGRRVLDRGRLPPTIDHPVPLELPEADYLKVHLLEVPA